LILLDIGLGGVKQRGSKTVHEGTLSINWLKLLSIHEQFNTTNEVDEVKIAFSYAHKKGALFVPLFYASYFIDICRYQLFSQNRAN
jgi:hypothetical protein